MKTRAEMIDRLVLDDMDIIENGIMQNDYDYLRDILRGGKGYDFQTDDEIAQEFYSRTWEDGHEEEVKWKPHL